MRFPSIDSPAPETRFAARFRGGSPAGSRSIRMKSGCPSWHLIRSTQKMAKPSITRRCTSPATARWFCGDRRARKPSAFLETVEFTAVDFLADEPERDAEIHARFGPQVAELVRRDRQQNVRRAFRSFPLHELPLSDRTINPYAFYEAHLAGGRIALLPFTLARGLSCRGAGSPRHLRRRPRDPSSSCRPRTNRPVRHVLGGPAEDTSYAQTCVHGLALVTGPVRRRVSGTAVAHGTPGHRRLALMETDLDYIGATRQDRIIAEHVQRQHQERLEWVLRWLDRFGWTFEKLPAYLAREIPFLANRGGEALRALVTACILDHNDIATLALAIGGLKRVLAYAADPLQDPKKVPAGLPDPVVNLRRLWHPVHRCKRPVTELFELPCFPAYTADERRRSWATSPAPPRGTRLDQGCPGPGRSRPLGHGQGPDARRALAHRPLERRDPRLAQSRA